MQREVWRTEIIELKQNDSLKLLCFRTKNLYNRAMSLFKKEYSQSRCWLSYPQLDRILKNEEVYTLLPAHTAQHTLKFLTRNWINYVKALKEFKKSPQLFNGIPRIPKYKQKNGLSIAIFTNQQMKIKNGVLIFPKKVNFSTKTRLSARTKLKEVRIIPRGIGYTLEIVYSKSVPKLTNQRKRIGAIDLGVQNLLTYVDNIGSRSIVVKDEGMGIKSIIRYYLKEIKKLQTKYAQQQNKTLKQKNKLVYGKRYNQLREMKRKKVKNWIHQMSNSFVKYWIKNGLDLVLYWL